MEAHIAEGFSTALVGEYILEHGEGSKTAVTM